MLILHVDDVFDVTTISIHTGIESDSKVFNDPMAHVYRDVPDELRHFMFQVSNCLGIVSVDVNIQKWKITKTAIATEIMVISTLNFLR